MTSDYLEHFRHVIVVHAGALKCIQDMTREIIVWATSKRFSVPSPRSWDSYELHRFMLDKDGTGSWKNDGHKRSRQPSSVILVKGQMEAILQDIRAFLAPNTEAWYMLHGIPQRLSYLFFGPPGTGKTSTIRAISSEFGHSCCFLSMASDKFSNQALGDAIAEMPSDALIVLEDVDALFTKRKSTSNSLTFSGLLNALDGVMSAEGVITIMTTNHIERLVDAILRGGRIDRRFYFGPPGDAEICRLFHSFYHDTSEGLVTGFLDAIWKQSDKKNARSMATLQQMFIYRPKIFRTGMCDGS